MARIERRAGGRVVEQGVLRSFVGSAALHGVVVGLGCWIGFGAVATAPEPAALRAQTTSVVRVESEPLVREEPERVPEAVAEERLLPEPELLPLAPEEAPEFEQEPTFAPVPEPATRGDFDVRRDFAAAREPVADVPAPERASPLPEPPPVAAPEPGELVLTPPVPIFAPDPEYPRLALRRGEEGVVLCRIRVDARGAVSGVELEESSGSERLDEAALAALRTWRFEPGTIDGVRSPSIYRHRVRFEVGGA